MKNLKTLILVFMITLITNTYSMNTLYLNMNSRCTLGNVVLHNITGFEITETVQEISSTAKLTVPKAYGKIGQRPILELLKVGDPVLIELGYDGMYAVEFEGFISEIEAEAPLVIHCDDRMFPYKQNNRVKSYGSASLKKVLTDLFPSLEIDCPEVNLGRFQIDNASSFEVIQELQNHHGLFSRLMGNTLRVGLAYDFADKSRTHVYDIRKNVKGNDLAYKRKEDVQVRFKATAHHGNGKKTTVMIGSKHPNASERTLSFAGNFTKKELEQKARACLAKVSYDGYTGSITGIGVPQTQAGDCLKLIDRDNPEREGTYMIETVEKTYNDSGFSRRNTLSYKI